MSQSRSSVLSLRARSLRSAPTLSEALLWSRLSGRRLGVGFRRQVPVSRYIADFLAPSVKLVVEVDGGCHTEPSRQRLDARRDREFRRLGYTVVRVGACEVLRDVGSVVGVVREAVLAASAVSGAPAS